MQVTCSHLCDCSSVTLMLCCLVMCIDLWDKAEPGSRDICRAAHDWAHSATNGPWKLPLYLFSSFALHLMFLFFCPSFHHCRQQNPKGESKELHKERKVFSECRNESYTSEVVSSLNWPASKWRHSICHQCAFYADIAFKGKQTHLAEFLDLFTDFISSFSRSLLPLLGKSAYKLSASKS